MERSGSIQLDIPDFSNSVLSHLNQLRVQGRLCDIVVNVQGQSFRAHKVVLAASSPYFRDHMSLSQMSTVSLTVIRNPSVFEQLLSFCYTGRLCLQLADIISYLTAASFLQMQHIIDRCTQILEGIHLKISLADLDEESREEEAVRGSRGSRTLEAVVRGGGHHGGLRLLGPRGGAEACEAVSPAEDPLSPPPTVEHSGLEGPGTTSSRVGKEPILRINRAGQWYVETSSEPERTGSAEEGGSVDGVRIKTERMEEWIGAGEHQEEVGVVEEGATVMIDTSGRSTLVTGPVGTLGTRSVQPSSSFSEADRFSPTGSVVVLAERQRAKSESPSRADELRQPSSQGEEHAAFDMGSYEDYLREQVGDRWFRYNPRLTCIYCCKSFNQKGSLDRHMRLHMGITPFVCRICGKKYTRKDQLEYHIRKHTGNKPFHCHVCGKSFPFQAILNQHFRKNHPGCTPQEAHSASPETTTASVTSRGGPSDEASPSQEEPEGGGGGGGSSVGGAQYGEGPQASVSTTGPD
ncbi:zinc finger and BTB domain-containing protein 37 [Amphiprion ocellaris]|uniref:Zinc finger and BTB domain containing 37 n=1 Tax=Amphiprion ocellaris TaxID=80972 RepID=A0A3Q1B8T2_AMPOC|nr:zinc finger and BTB domain-containing protein 37 [Amphiprion ocellaris]XP_035802592.1 zinc finger and BTB domain-containing protein 37 [Amphiprion ocellaris]XP_054870255.1 zinc finger and BTB domain-containing protein 37 [Amphiprion ocellaris]